MLVGGRGVEVDGTRVEVDAVVGVFVVFGVFVGRSVRVGCDVGVLLGCGV